MKYVYPAVFHKEDGSFWVEFPDLAGCQTYGDTLEDVIEQASEALGLYIAAKLDNNIQVPAPSDIQDIEAESGCFTSYVSTDSAKYRNKSKAVKKTLSIPGWLNDEAEKRHINFSGVLQNALMQELHIDNRP